MALNLKWSMLIVLILCINSIFCRTKVTDLYITTSKEKKYIKGGFFTENGNTLILNEHCLYHGDSKFKYCTVWAHLELPLQNFKYKNGKCNTNDDIYEINVYDSDGDHTREIANLKYLGQNKKSNRIYVSFNNGCRIEGKFNYNNIKSFYIWN